MLFSNKLVALAAFMAAAMALIVVASTADKKMPAMYTDDSGNLHLNTTDSETVVFFNGVDVLSTLADMQAKIASLYNKIFSPAFPANPTKTKILPSGLASGDQYGSAVSISGSTAVVTARLRDTDGKSNSGAVYVYSISSDGELLQEQVLTPSALAVDDHFGYSVDLVDNVLVVGAQSGQFAFVYERASSDDDFVLVNEIVSSDLSSGDGFGWQVVILDSVTVAVSAPYNDEGNLDAGAVYLFEKSSVSGQYTQVQKIQAASTVLGGQFGHDLATTLGTLLAVATRFENRAHIFQKGSNGQFARLQTMTGGQEYGTGVAIDGNLVVISSYSINGVGAAYVSEMNSETGLYVELQVIAGNVGSGADFGEDMTLQGNYLVIGSPGANKVSVYSRNETGTTFELLTILTGNDEEFGRRLEMQGSLLLVGARSADEVGANSGAAYLFSP